MRLWMVTVTVLLSAVAALPQGAVYNENKPSRSILDQVGDYEVTFPVWLHSQRHRRSPREEQHPPETQVVITAEGHELTLHLEKNEQLLAPGYQQIWYSPDGTRVSSAPGKDEHCFYHGKVEGIDGSSVVVSTCSGLRGLISFNASVSYLVEPFPVYNDTRQQQHAVFRADRLHLQTGHCPHHHGNHGDLEGGLNIFIHGMMSPHNKREKRDLTQNMKYVELLLVADRAEFQKHGSSLEKTQLKLLEAANLVDKYYKALNIRVALIGLEVWTNQDLISVSDNPHSTLASFLSWRGKHLRTLPNDNAQLITGRSFQGTTIGLAPLKAMCSDFQSGGVNTCGVFTDHSESAVGVAATMAHEMGHNFGMSHDVPGCCQAKAEDGGCIMAAATGHVRGQRCGNGYLEEGEECDCGEEEKYSLRLCFVFCCLGCTSPCCNANNCTLKAGARGCCAAPPPDHVTSRILRRESRILSCQLLPDGRCHVLRGRAYCYTGMCLTLEQQCRSLWGKDGRPAPELCFRKVNEAGDMYGNCGKDLNGKYRKCTERDAKCGKIQCLSSATKPLETSAVRIETTVTIGSKKFLCMGTHVYKFTQGDEEPQGDTLDPGLVMTGTKCGEDSICFNGVCRNASFLRTAECNAKCHGHGMCNNNHNCHCDPGWAPPLCDQRGSGGSVDSGPVISNTVGLWCCYKHKLRPLKTSAPPPVPSCSVPVEVKPLNDSSHINGHANPTFLLKKQETDQLSKSSPGPSPSCPSRSRQGVVRPAVKPPPVPPIATNKPKSQTEEDSHSSVKPTQKKTPAPRPPPGPPPSLPPNSKPSAPSGPKSRPDPPNRPPPPCPVTLATDRLYFENIYMLFLFICCLFLKRCLLQFHTTNTEQPKVKNVQITSAALQKKKTALAPSAGQKKPNRT
ncbi:hypothetical protein WMY93_009483 [Mugilogobius chulae]|uniref:ADAM metallopeptidase domain 19b n=1 Tax=Mugilogobius chulae TaxID=88201 RepID=A0AAW0PCZ9_9GOBI